MRTRRPIPQLLVIVATFMALFIAAPVNLVLAAGPPQQASKGDVRITVLQTTDLHHHANGADHVGLDVDPVGGTSSIGAYSRIAAYVNNVRNTADHPVLLVDSGDWTMGTLYDLTLGAQPLALDFLQRMRYDCVTLGNHEFDYGPRGLAQMIANAQNTVGFRTPIVASNMSLNGNTDLAPLFGAGKLIQPYRIQLLDRGVRVAFIGLMGAAAAFAAPASAPVSFTDPASGYPAIQSLVDSLRQHQGIDIVIALSHSGTDATGTSGEDVELARHVKGINVIASGHTHTPLATARTVANGSWNTYIIDAGAYGTNVARIDLTYHRPGKTTTLDGSSNVAMTDASLAAIAPGLTADAGIAFMVRQTDAALNAALAPFFAQTFPDYNSGNVATGIYHPVGMAAQDMISNDLDFPPPPNGLGDLAADGVRNMSNAIIAQTLVAAGGNPANLPGYDFTPIQFAVVATGVLRGSLRAGVPLSFADIYNVLPLGITPDASQSLPVGFPLISGYMEVDDLRKVAALQLVLQTGLASADNYVNISGIRYGIKAAEGYAYFKFATAATVLKVTSGKAAAGSALAQQALNALSTLATDSGAALLGAAASGNSYAQAMVALNDSNPSQAQVAANLFALGQTAAAAVAGGNAVSALVVSKAVAAIDTIDGFGPTDIRNTGATVDLTSGPRVRIVADLFAILSLGAVQAQFGTAINVYQSPTGSTTLSDFPTLLANRIDAAPATAGTQELKEWMALLGYVGSDLGGFIDSAYRSTGNFTQFASFGAAVQSRNGSYPLATIGQLLSTAAGLSAGP